MWEERLHKLSDADRERAIRLREEGIPSCAIAKRFNVSDATVCRVLGEEGNPALVDDSKRIHLSSRCQIRTRGGARRKKTVFADGKVR